MGGIVRGDVVESTDVMVPEQGNAPAPQVREQQEEKTQEEKKPEEPEKESD